MNPVTASATFHVGQFLEDIVGVATTRGDMSATFPTKLGYVGRGQCVFDEPEGAAEVATDVVGERAAVD